MSKKKEAIVKKFTFSAQEKDTLENLEVGLISFNAGLNGMLIHKQMLLREAYKRNGITEVGPTGYVRQIQYSLMRNEIIVTDIPAPKEEKKDEVKASAN